MGNVIRFLCAWVTDLCESNEMFVMKIPPGTLYKSRPWANHSKTVVHLIIKGKLAPLEDGVDTEQPKSKTEECPICFLFYTEVNITLCCKKFICSECYLQLCPDLGETHRTCPFCNSPRFLVLCQPRPSLSKLTTSLSLPASSL